MQLWLQNPILSGYAVVLNTFTYYMRYIVFKLYKLQILSLNAIKNEMFLD